MPGRIREWTYTRLPNGEIEEPYPSDHRIDVVYDPDASSVEIRGVLLDGDSSERIAPVVWTNDGTLEVELRGQRIDGEIAFALIQYVPFELRVVFEESLPKDTSVRYVNPSGDETELAVE